MSIPRSEVEMMVSQEKDGSVVADKEAQTNVNTIYDSGDSSSGQDGNSKDSSLPPVPLQMKLLSVFLVTCIGFGSQWSSGVTGAMKSTIKKVCCGCSILHFPRKKRSGLWDYRG